MKQVHSGKTPVGVVVAILLAIFLINGIATYLQYTIIPNITKFISVIVILTFYYTKYMRMANVFLTIFMLLFLGDTFSVFNLGEFTHKLSKTFYLGSYFLLLFVLIGKFKRIKYEGLVSVYLIIVLFLNSYFLYALYSAVKDNFADNINLILYICHGVALIAMAFFAFAVYLSKESTQAILFLVMVFCLVFSDVLRYICNLYVYYWAFDFMANMLHIASLCLFYAYVYNHHKFIKVKGKTSSEEEYVLERSDRIPA